MAITPKMLSNLKNRKSEKTWWLRQQQRGYSIRSFTIAMRCDRG
jgi:hypothetical protein